MRLEWGLPVPDDAVSAWGCRAIVTQRGWFDIVPDRTDRQGTDEVLALLNVQYPLARLAEDVAGLLRSGQMNTRAAKPFTLHQSSTLTVIADTRASAGYCYVAAWTAGQAANGAAGAAGLGAAR